MLFKHKYPFNCCCFIYKVVEDISMFCCYIYQNIFGRMTKQIRITLTNKKSATMYLNMITLFITFICPLRTILIYLNRSSERTSASSAPILRIAR